MIVELARIDEMAVKANLDLAGVDALLVAFEHALRSGHSFIHVQLDPYVISKRRGPRAETRVELIRSAVEVPSLTQEDHGVSWILGSEDLESGAEHLRGARERGHFSPAEFLRVQTAKRRKIDWIYAELCQQTG